MNKIFPTIMIVLQIAAALVYLFASGDIRKCVYWLAAAVLTTAVTY